VLAQAVQELFPGTQVTIGPAIEDGFYYDFARDEPFSLDGRLRGDREADGRDRRPRRDLVREVWDRDEAIALFEAKGETFKAEI
jgi:threonyl-tRNA synthetase